MSLTQDQLAVEAAWRAAATACVKDGVYTAPESPEDWEAALRPALTAALQVLGTKPVTYGRLRDGRLVGLGYDHDADADMTVPLGIIGSLADPTGPPAMDRRDELELIMDVCRTTVIAGNTVPVHQVRRLQEFYAKAGATEQSEELRRMFTAAADPSSHLSLPRLVRSGSNNDDAPANTVDRMVSALRNVIENGSSGYQGECGGWHVSCCHVLADEPPVKHAPGCCLVEAQEALAAHELQLAPSATEST